MTSLLLRLSAIALVFFTLQGCIITQMLFNPAVRTAFIVPDQLTPTAEIKRDPGKYTGKHIAISGTATEVTTDFLVVDDLIRIKRFGHLWEKDLKVGDNVSVEGKLAASFFQTSPMNLRYANAYKPGPQAAR